MKHIHHHPEPTEHELKGPKYWRSLDEVADTPGFRQWLEEEFPRGASQLEATSGIDRRHFLKIMASSFAFAGLGLAGCRQPRQHILAYAKQPERVVPGVATYFASSRPDTYDNIPVITQTHQNRPTKIEGNPSYLAYNGATDIWTQASILDLYDPDRATQSVDVATKRALSQAEVLDLLTALQKEYTATQGQGLAILMEPSTSPTQARLVRELQTAFPKALYTRYTAFPKDGPQNAYSKAFGANVRPIYRFAKAKRVLSLDCDFVNQEPGHLAYARDFASQRTVKTAGEAASMSRLYMAESNFTLTGGMADHRIRLATGLMPLFAARMAAEVLKLTGGSSRTISSLMLKSQGLGIEDAWIQECAKDLVSHGPQALVVTGYHLGEECHMLALMMNQQLGAIGQTVELLKRPEEPAAITLDELIGQMHQGQVKTLVIMGGNPVFQAPRLADALTKVAQVVRFGEQYDETTARATTHIAASHYLETWSDGRTWDGTYVPVQPMILPLFETLSEIEVLSRLAGNTMVDPYAQVQSTFHAEYSGASLETTLAEGLVKDSQYALGAPQLDNTAVLASIDSAQWNAPALDKDNLEVRIVPSHPIADGRYANNGWMQECSDPMTKLCWGNAILISPKLAQELEAASGIPLFRPHTLMNETQQLQSTLNNFDFGKENAFIGELQVNGQVIRGPMHIQPGLADYTIVIPAGYGRTHCGRVGTNVGFSVYPIHTASTLANATLQPTNERALLANVQEHWSMEGRALLREANVAHYMEQPRFVDTMCMESHTPPIYGANQNDPLYEKVNHIPRGGSLFQTPQFKGLQQWGMTIDLGSCTGCNACVIACQSENNVPIVGKEQVLRGREMHWMRIDRYFATGPTEKGALPENPQVAFMGVLCQHCELAPCESVCPVNATVHDEEGLNVMAYNRCVGTRYCANNCPYKVRKFNFFDWNKRDRDHFYEGPFGPSGVAETLKMQKNPDVTVRMRGVMEKCTFCVQRIEEAKITQRNKAGASGDVKVPDGAIKTACQQVCPTQAIVFGDVADPQSQVSELKASERNYRLLGYLNTRPRVTYLARIRNPNPQMPDYYQQPLSRLEYEKRYGHAHAAEHSA